MEESSSKLTESQEMIESNIKQFFAVTREYFFAEESEAPKQATERN